MLNGIHMTNEILEALLKVIDEGIHVIDMEGITILYNEIAASHDGMEPAEVIGRHVLESFPSLDKDTSTLLQVIKSGKPIYNKSQTYLNMHARTIDTVNTTLPIHIDGKLAGAVEVAKDLSKMRKISERLMELEDRQKRPKPKKGTDAIFLFDDLITVNREFRAIISQAKKAAGSSSSVLVHGESGAGKELFVQGIHNASNRRNKPFIAQNCAALPDSLLESLLFGTAKGSYTGAVDRPGLFESASGGTLFLDEIQSMSPALQSKLLRVLEDGVVRRVGATKTASVDVRLIAATNIDPEEAVRKGILRMDLYYRLNVLPFRLPPLRERKEDIPVLSAHFIEQFNARLLKKVDGMTNSLTQALLEHPWKGNVRELKHCIEYMMNVADSHELDVGDLPAYFLERRNKPGGELPPLRIALMEAEKDMIKKALNKTGGNVLKAAEILQVPRQTLQYKIKKHFPAEVLEKNLSS